MGFENVISDTVAEFNKILEHLKDEFTRLQIGRASSALIENIGVELYGSNQPIKAVASISIPDPRTIQIQPWDKGSLSHIEKAIVGVGIGLNPINNGVSVIINIPPLTEERRADLVKLVNKYAEDARISVRTARSDAIQVFKKMKTDGDLTEDDWYEAEKKLQVRVDEYNKKVEELAAQKEKDVMTI